MDKNIQRECAVRLARLRAEIIDESPFFGRLLMHLSFGFDNCETAYTDMKRVVFDMEFMMRLSDPELKFVMLHELMHCVLKHCTRGNGRIHILYNIACDIVVNSLLIKSLNLGKFKIDGQLVMHHAPDKREGFRYTAEEVYDMLLNMSVDEAAKMYSNQPFDSHEQWGDISVGAYIESVWESRIKEACKSCGQGSGIPNNLKRYIEDISGADKINWRQILHDFIQNDSSDYLFAPPDRRFDSDFFLPSFQENVNGSAVENIWFLIDSSGSVSDDMISSVYYELKNAIDQIGNLKGLLSYFDTKVSTPAYFDDKESFDKIKPVGGGGTSFYAIFNFMAEYFKEELPKAIVIITDGYANFPEEEMAKGLPVVWVIVDSGVTPPWGEVINIDNI